MKILFCGDQHITNKKPKNRTDDYFSTVMNKFKQELLIAEEEKCQVMVLPGDVFDTYKENHEVVQAVIKTILEFDIRVLCVAGQHDQQFHNADLTGTALGTLIAAEVVTPLGKEPVTVGGINFYGASWKEPIPEIKSENEINILVTHLMIIEEKLWAQQEGHTWANHILTKNHFNAICSGDNHQQFIVSKGKKHLVNMGSMLRSNISQEKHHPAVAVYSTNSNTVDIIDLDIKAFNTIMQMDKAKKEKEKKEQMQDFIATLKVPKEAEGHAIKLDFVEALHNHLEENDYEVGVVDIINSCLEGE